MATVSPGPTPAERLAFLLSVVLSPFLVVPFFCVVLAREVARTQNEFYLLSFLCTVFSIGVPMAYIAWHVWHGNITDMHVREREQRSAPYRAGILGLGSLSLVLYAIDGPIELTRVALVMCLQGFVFERINRRTKISMHTGVLAAMLGCAIEICRWSPMCLWSLLPLIWARTVRKRHHVLQGLAGAGLGYGLTVYPLRLMRYIWG